MRVAISINHYIKIFLGQKAPAIRANSLVVRLDQIGTALGVTFARQLHHLGPLVEATITIAICSIPIIAVTFNCRIVRLIFCNTNHLADIQVFCHYCHRILLTLRVLAPYGEVIIGTAIAFICKLLIFVSHFTQSHRMVERHIFAAARHARTRFRTAARFCRAARRFCAATGFFFA